MGKDQGVNRFIAAVSDFVFAEDEPQKSDVIFIPGSSHPEHALWAAELYCQGMADYLLPSGRYSAGMEHFKGVPEEHRREYPGEYETEWAFFHEVLRKAGVPENAILREDRATFTWENAQLSRRVTDELGLRIRRALLCCRGFHARRAFLYYQAAFPEAEIRICPVSMPGEGRDDWFTTAKGRQRIMGEVSRLGGQVDKVFEMMLGCKEFPG